MGAYSLQHEMVDVERARERLPEELEKIRRKAKEFAERPQPTISKEEIQKIIGKYRHGVLLIQQAQELRQRSYEKLQQAYQKLHTPPKTDYIMERIMPTLPPVATTVFATKAAKHPEVAGALKQFKQKQVERGEAIVSGFSPVAPSPSFSGALFESGITGSTKPFEEYFSKGPEYVILNISSEVLAAILFGKAFSKVGGWIKQTETFKGLARTVKFSRPYKFYYERIKLPVKTAYQTKLKLPAEKWLAKRWGWYRRRLLRGLAPEQVTTPTLKGEWFKEPITKLKVGEIKYFPLKKEPTKIPVKLWFKKTPVKPAPPLQPSTVSLLEASSYFWKQPTPGTTEVWISRIVGLTPKARKYYFEYMKRAFITGGLSRAVIQKEISELGFKENFKPYLPDVSPTKRMRVGNFLTSIIGVMPKFDITPHLAKKTEDLKSKSRKRKIVWVMPKFDVTPTQRTKSTPIIKQKPVIVQKRKYVQTHKQKRTTRTEISKITEIYRGISPPKPLKPPKAPKFKWPKPVKRKRKGSPIFYGLVMIEAPVLGPKQVLKAFFGSSKKRRKR